MAPAVSVASTRKVNVPAAVGVPVMLAPLMASPGGSAPDHSDQVTAPVVPAAASAWLYAVPWLPPGKLAVVTCTAEHHKVTRVSAQEVITPVPRVSESVNVSVPPGTACSIRWKIRAALGVLPSVVHPPGVPHDCPVGTLECTTAVAVSARPPVTLAAAPPVTGPGVADDTCAEATPVRSTYWNAAADECSWMRPLTVAPVLE